MIAWPAGAEPGGADIHVCDEIVADVAPERVWAWLVRAARWSELYDNCKALRFVSQPGPDLALGTEFTWRTFGVRVATRIDELVPGRALAWSGRGLGGHGYHAWLLEPRDGGVYIRTEETQRGWMPRWSRWWLRGALGRSHRRWLGGLVAAARQGVPDDITVLTR
jgi:hypothetical protein